jgi:hypothetical protein
VGIQISAQDPHIARARIPVFIPLALVHDIFMQQSINNVVCIVYDEVKSNLKGVLLYVLHPSDAQLLREGFRQVKQSYCSKGIAQTTTVDDTTLDNHRLASPTSQKTAEVYRSVKNNRQQSPRRILYVREGEMGMHRELTPSSAISALPQLNYTPLKNSYHSHRDDSVHRRQHSPKKGSRPSSDHAAHHRSPNDRSELIMTKLTPETVEDSPSQDILKSNTAVAPENQSNIAWQTMQAMPVIPMGIYNR